VALAGTSIQSKECRRLENFAILACHQGDVDRVLIIDEEEIMDEVYRDER
jgi:hypothetical protein